MTPELACGCSRCRLCLVSEIDKKFLSTVTAVILRMCKSSALYFLQTEVMSSPPSSPPHDAEDGFEGHEASPLLPSTNGQPGSSENQGVILSNSKSITTLIIYFMALHFCIAFCEMVLVAPLVKIFEHSLCLNYFGFPIGGVEDEWCNIPEIQHPLATIRGWKSMFDTIPGRFRF